MGRCSPAPAPPAPRHLVAEVIHQLAHIGREVIHLAAALASQRPHGALIGARRTAQAQIDAIRIERSQGAELLGDHQRRVVRQHDAARPERRSWCRRPDGRSAPRWRLAMPGMLWCSASQ
jgi:hypothetical protein